MANTATDQYGSGQMKVSRSSHALFDAFTPDQIDNNLFPTHPDGGERKLFVGETSKGWATFERVFDGSGEYRSYRECNKWHGNRLMRIRNAVTLEFISGPNGAQVVRSWKPRFS